MINTISHILTWVIVAFLGWLFFMVLIEKIVGALFGGRIAGKVTNWLFFAPLVLPVIAGFCWVVWTGLSGSPVLCYIVTAVIIFTPLLSARRCRH